MSLRYVFSSSWIDWRTYFRTLSGVFQCNTNAWGHRQKPNALPDLWRQRGNDFNPLSKQLGSDALCRRKRFDVGDDLILCLFTITADRRKKHLFRSGLLRNFQNPNEHLTAAHQRALFYVLTLLAQSLFVVGEQGSINLP